MSRSVRNFEALCNTPFFHQGTDYVPPEHGDVRRTLFSVLSAEICNNSAGPKLVFNATEEPILRPV